MQFFFAKIIKEKFKSKVLVRILFKMKWGELYPTIPQRTDNVFKSLIGFFFVIFINI